MNNVSKSLYKINLEKNIIIINLIPLRLLLLEKTKKKFSKTFARKNWTSSIAESEGPEAFLINSSII